MPIYELQKATLGDIEGEGYIFSRKSTLGKTFKGVFFCEDPEPLVLMQEQEEVTFTGAVYDGSRERQESLSVEVTGIMKTMTGERADLLVVEDE